MSDIISNFKEPWKILSKAITYRIAGIIDKAFIFDELTKSL